MKKDIQLESRMGRFRISYFMYHREGLYVVRSIFKFLNFIPTRVDSPKHHDDAFEYIGISHKFDKVTKGEMILLYEIAINNKVVSIKKIKM